MCECSLLVVSVQRNFLFDSSFPSSCGSFLKVWFETVLIILRWPHVVDWTWKSKNWLTNLFQDQHKTRAKVTWKERWSSARSSFTWSKRFPEKWSGKSVGLWPGMPTGLPSRGGDVTIYVWHKPAVLAHSFSFCSCVYLCLYGSFNCMSFHKFSQQLRFLTLFSRSYLCLTGPFNYIIIPLSKSLSALI